MGRHSIDTAETLILAGLIFQGLTVVALLGIGLYFLVVPILGGIVLLLAFLALVWLILVYVFSYARIRDGDYEGACTPTLLFAILTLVLGGILSGILYLIGYVKLVDAVDDEEARRAPLHTSSVPPTYSPPARAPYVPATAAPLPPATSPPSSAPVASGSNFCSNCGRPTPPRTRFCRNCGAPLQ